jgi:hypothetical protein
MTTTNEAERQETGPPVSDAQGKLPALVMLAGTLISLSGLAWDIGWHTDVGPDSFFTLPHLFVYSGGAIAGLTSLVMVLRATSAQRRGVDPHPAVGGRAFKVLGVFAAPIGYLIGGIAAASFLLYGLWDEWWHGLYGFDVTIASPPHQGWLNSICMTIMGTVIVFAAAREHRWGRYGLITALAAFGSYFTITSSALGDINLDSPINWDGIAWVVIPIACVLLGARVLPRGGAVGTGLLNLVVNLVIWNFANWAVVWYADVQHLALRDFSELGFPVERLILPTAVFVFSVVVELLLRWRDATVWLLGLYGSVGAVAIIWWVNVQFSSDGDGPDAGRSSPSLVLTCVAAGVLGALIGMAIWRLGYAMRLANTRRTDASDVAVAA